MNSKCSHCSEIKELTCCKECAWNLVIARMGESLQGDTANRIKFLIDDRIGDLENKLDMLFKDKLIVCVKHGKRLRIV